MSILSDISTVVKPHLRIRSRPANPRDSWPAETDERWTISESSPEKIRADAEHERKWNQHYYNRGYSAAAGTVSIPGFSPDPPPKSEVTPAPRYEAFCQGWCDSVAKQRQEWDTWLEHRAAEARQAERIERVVAESNLHEIDLLESRCATGHRA